MTVYAGFNRDLGTRMDSSSGGVFSAIARQVIDNKGVVYGAGFASDFSVEYYAAETFGNLTGFRKSKYVQSRFDRNCLVDIQNHLKNGRTVLFCGTPCHAEVVRRCVKSDVERLYIIDFVCHGVPYQKAWSAYIQYQEKLHNSKIKCVDFRDKRDSWRRYSIQLEFLNGDVYRSPYMEDPYMKAFLCDLILNTGCYDCQYKGIERRTDLTIGDFWGIEKIMPEMDDDRGTSLILVHSEKGKSLLENAANELNVVTINSDNYIQYNPSLVHSATKNSFYYYMFKRLGKRRFDQLVDDCISPSFTAKIMQKLDGRIHRA